MQAGQQRLIVEIGVCVRAFVPVEHSHHLSHWMRPLAVGAQFGGRRVLQVSCGHTHTMVMTDIHVNTLGQGKTGQLGHGHLNNLNIPTRVEGIIANYMPIMIAAGERHSIVLLLMQPEDKTHKHSQSVFTWGYNYFGELGLGHTMGQKLAAPTSMPKWAQGLKARAFWSLRRCRRYWRGSSLLQGKKYV